MSRVIWQPWVAYEEVEQDHDISFREQESGRLWFGQPVYEIMKHEYCIATLRKWPDEKYYCLANVRIQHVSFKELNQITRFIATLAGEETTSA